MFWELHWKLNFPDCAVTAASVFNQHILHHIYGLILSMPLFVIIFRSSEQMHYSNSFNVYIILTYKTDELIFKTLIYYFATFGVSIGGDTQQSALWKVSVSLSILPIAFTETFYDMWTCQYIATSCEGHEGVVFNFCADTPGQLWCLKWFVLTVAAPFFFFVHLSISKSETLC